MSMTDPIADMLTRIRNALMVDKAATSMQASRVKSDIARVLKNEGYITDFKVSDGPSGKVLDITLKYHEGRPAIDVLQRISKPGRRVYVGGDELPRVIGGMGIAIISTSHGILTEREARRKGVGGEVLCFIH